MRYHELLEARSPTGLYYHITRAENIPSILKRGLIPNHSNDGTGRYEDSRWYSLDGVYATKKAALAFQIAGGMDGPFAVVVLSASPKSTLPDEDVIEILARECYVMSMTQWGIDIRQYEDSPSDYFEDNEDSEFTMDDVWSRARKLFHEKARGSRDNIPYNDELLERLFDYWSTYGIEEFSDGDNDPGEWMAIKDQIAKLYRHNMNAGNFDQYSSIRIPGPVTFGGRNRIIAITTGPSPKDIVYGKLTPEAQKFVAELY